MKHAVILALLLLVPAATAAAIHQSAYVPPARGAAGGAVPDKRKPMPSPAPTEHYASPPASAPRWTI
ncbi:MAG: hypothetical protein WAO95_16920 [Burkholderiales bacterium]